MKRVERRFMVIFFIFIVITMISYVIIYNIGSKEISQNTVDRLYSTGLEQKLAISQWLDDQRYVIKFFSECEEIQSMNKEKISDKIDFIKCYKDIYQNILVITKDKKIIHGRVENEKTFFEQDYIKKGFLGDFTVSEPVKDDGKYYLDIVNCIKKDNIIVGVICFRILANDINKIIEQDARQESMECYIVDKNGMFITSSKFGYDIVGKEKLDLDRIKLNIDYSKDTPYNSYRNKLVYGMYYPMDINNWVLIIEKEASSNIQLKKVIILICSVTIFIQLISMIFIKRILLKDCIESN